eukprot:XP_003729082.1 PREDICTED: N-acetyllactosaminide beta-1,6-N-acetylglucosaminyl-transferase, isoform C-like [Strongylocentrotus purpuratus]
MANSSFHSKLVLLTIVFGVCQFLIFMSCDSRDDPRHLSKQNSAEKRALGLKLKATEKSRPIITSDARTKVNKSSSDVNVTAMLPKVRFDGTWNSSFVAPMYHRYYQANCASIFADSRQAIDEANRLMGKSKEPIAVPSDETVLGWTKDCEVFERERRYPNKPRSVEEEEYPIAFVIVTHKEVAQVERLLRAIYHPQNVYCIHPDVKSPPVFQEAIRGLASCFDNVFIVSKVEDVQYAGFTRLQADVNCMSDLLQHSVHWRYVINMCSQDFPLKTNLEMVRQLKAYKGKNDINGILPPSYIKGRTRTHFIAINGKMTATRKHKTPPPNNLTIYFGNAYYAASRAFVDYVINNQVAVDLLHWSEDTFSPDEHYWVTLNRSPGVPGGYSNATWDSNVRFMKWGDVPKHPPCKGKYVRALCVFGVGYLNYLAKMTHLFANKFYYSYDPVTLQCLEELLDFRTAHPETISDFVPNFPVTDLLWQLN